MAIFLALGVATLAIVEPGQLVSSLYFTFSAFAGILPFVVLAAILASLATATGADSLIAAAFTGRPLRSVSLAALAGALSPFCSCGVVPLIAALLRARVPLPPVMAFWIASPIMDPEMFVLTTAGISLEFAAAKTMAAIGMGLSGGLTMHWFGLITSFRSPMTTGAADSCGTSIFGRRIMWRFWRVPERLESFRRQLTTMLVFLGKWLLLAFFLESLMSAWLPADAVALWLGTGSWYEVPLAAAIGMPAYINGYAAIPLLAELMEKGMNPGAAMAFMTAGAVSSVPAAMAVAVLVRRWVFVAYLLIGSVGSITAGLLYAQVAG